jgi:eukaryotic-like serine/threonine-protein kinase
VHLEPGARLGHYEIGQRLAAGGMGVVYAAVDTRLRRPAAIKVLPPDVTADEERKRRFVQEARAASTLNHPGIVTIYDVDEDAGVTFIAMELIDGTPLDALLADGPLAVPTALDYGAQAAAALEAAHAAGIVHRDVKPANLIVTRDGRVKVLDFGLAKLVEPPPGEATVTSMRTRAGVVMGTAAYMSPEQAAGRPVDARSDIFSLGAVLYEMLAGTRAFKGTSDLAIVGAVLHDDPPPVTTVRHDVPALADGIVRRTLAKRPEARYQSAADLKRDLAAAHAQVTGVRETPRRSRPGLAAVTLIAVLAAMTIVGWQTVHARQVRWARDEAIPQIERLRGTTKTLEAVRLAERAERYVPDDIARVKKTWMPLTLVTEPAGAHVQIRNYADVNGPWESFGETPVIARPLPQGYYRVRLSKPGYSTADLAMIPGPRHATLVPESAAVAGMVRVPGGPYSFGVSPRVTLSDYWIDRLEVTNREYKRFVDAGGYGKAEHWREPFRDGTRDVPFVEAVSRFRDTTGRPGPSTWELGRYPEEQADFPVGGISWYEAAAYARFAGKRLPTIYHWYKAAGAEEIFSDALVLSNFDRKGPVRAGERQGLGPFGTFDMAGNVKEWCSNVLTATGLRYILGGAWNEPSYRFNESDARDPWNRDPTFGMRLVKDPEAPAEADAPVGRITPDPNSVVPVSDAEFSLLRRFYDYDRSPLDARVTAVDDGSPDWRMETISFNAAYGGERVPAYFFTPKNGGPPYQTIVYFPTAYSRTAPSSARLDLTMTDFIVKSGRALMYPVYKGTYERRVAGEQGTNASRDTQVQQAKDFFRAMDYLETRKDVDRQRVGYYGMSMGGFIGPIPVALDTRVKAAVFAAAGLRYGYPPEVQTANFMPRVHVPVLLIAGRDDLQAPLAAQNRFIELLGTPAEHKSHLVLEGGHVPNDFHALIREVLSFFDKYFGVPNR